jgi:PAS domain S-box-containing protein
MSTDDDETVRLRARIAELTERAERAEKELEASRALHAATVESLPFDFWARDREGYCFSQNSTTRANWGDLLHKRPQDMQFPEAVIEKWLANNRRALSGEIVRGDVEYARGDEIRFIHNVLAPIRMNDAIVGTLGVNIDVTDQRRTLIALRESEAKLRMAVDAAGIGLWSWDPQRDLVVWEPALSAMFGLPPGTAPIGRDGFLALLHPDDRERVRARLAAMKGPGRWVDEYRIVRADGAVRWMQARGMMIRAGDSDRVLGAIIDVTETRQRDEQLRQAQKLEAVGQLTAGVAHNFNNMLMGVLPNLELAARRSNAEVLPLIECARDSAIRAADLVRQLMTYAGRNRLATRTVEDLGPLTARAVDLCRTTFDKRITFDQTYDADATARVDATQIEQALLNVLINARDAVADVERAPRVSIEVTMVRAGADELEERAGDHVRVRVSDNGVGMDEATTKRVYEPFFTTKDVGKGTGLGMATAHTIVREHGGFIVCVSALGRGTTFSLYLPFERSRARVERAPPSTPPARGTETVLVVDDEPAIRRVVALMLRGAGYTAHEAASGREALERLADRALAREVALVLLDVSMPGISRRELREHLRELTRARVVYFTGYGLDAADVGGDAQDVVLHKPTTEEILLRTVRQVLDR